MGLAAPRKRTKISHDPNNTAWTTDTQTFGHKILTSQGWSPGQFLGAKNASHAEFHTAANASHIRVTVKDDNLGLGAKSGSGVGQGECTGLDGFKDLLGRLNGKEEDEIEKDRRSRDDMRRTIYAHRKWGTSRFVKGGFLVGNKIESSMVEGRKNYREILLDQQSEESLADPKSKKKRRPEADEADVELQSKKSKKQRRKEQTLEVATLKEACDTGHAQSKSTKDNREEEPTIEMVAGLVPEDQQKESKKRRKEKTADVTAEVVAIKSKKQKDKKKRKRSRSSSEEAETPVQTDTSSKKDSKQIKQVSIDASEYDTQTRKHKKEKKHKSSKTSTSPSYPLEQDANSIFNAKPSGQQLAPKDVLVTKVTETPANSNPSSGTSTPAHILQGRHAVRSRNIAQKRLACMDIKSLNQIFMVNS